ncbi:MAG: site-2 protease family protein [Thermoguttaceae bacterium]|nr:site-2 protease family protein [Thermoguttaceae bacterium]
MPSIFLFAAYDFAFFKAVFLCAVALGLIIFIHELGHFLVAKACGVRCDKFYIGFDFFGLKLLKFKWGETEYGIGVFPLGGYVKMLGQEDNPGETRERINKAKAAREALAKNAEAKVDQAVLMTDEEIAEAEKLINDPRSYQAKSVPQRMAIIVAGVTMNVVLAFIAAAAAFMLGTSKLPCQLGSVHPGQGAWEAGLQSNDTLVQIEQNELKYFDDISKNVTLGNHLEEGINIQFERPSMPLIQTTKAFPKKTALAPMLGATAPLVPVLDETPVTPASPTFMAENDLKKGDVLVGIDEAEISINLDVQKALYASVGKNVTLKFLRPTEEARKVYDAKMKTLDLESDYETIKNEYVKDAKIVEVMAEPLHARNFGIVLTMGPIQCLRSGLEGYEGAGRAGLKVGDKIVGFETSVNGNVEMLRDLDPVTLPYLVQKRTRELFAQAAAAGDGAEKPAMLLNFAVQRKETGKEEIVPVEFSLDVFGADNYFFGSGEVLPEIGLTYDILPVVAKVLPGSEAEKKGVKPGFVLKSLGFDFKVPEETELSEKEKAVVSHFQKKLPPHEFRKDLISWPMIYHNSLMIFPLNETKAQVVFEDPETRKTQSMELPLEEYADVFIYHNDLNFQARTVFIKEGFFPAIGLGGQETWNSLTMVYRMLGKLFSGQVSVKGLGGPVLIAQVAYSSAKDGLAQLLMFVCLISANLAVLNLLPIPVLDGGHVVFLLWEGITGKAPNENLMIILSYLGLLLFLGLTIFVLGLDLGFISRF